jgi:hypothetical protein
MWSPTKVDLTFAVLLLPFIVISFATGYMCATLFELCVFELMLASAMINARRRYTEIVACR